jgi:predicted DNA-binding protein (MmcQ/YjbR family)
MAAKKQKPEDIERVLREFALRFPETYEEFPWGERAVKVKGKAFLFMRATAEEVSLSVKLPQSRDMAHDLPFAEPTAYGLGKHGWVTARIAAGAKAPLDLLQAWIDESYRAVAPKKIVAQLDNR